MNDQMFQKKLNKFKKGEIVSLKIKSKKIKIKGEIRQLFIENNKIYITLYLLFNRKEQTFILNKDLELIDIKKEHKIKNTVSLIELSKNDEIKPKRKIIKLLKKAIAALILISLILTINPLIRIPSISTSFSYEEFLKKEYSIYSLFQTVVTRIKYRYDVGEQWVTPENAWDNRYGDCEEFAGIISDYFHFRGIENYLVGINFKNSRQGHAVVFVRINNKLYIMDPTFALEPLGIREFKKAKDLNDAVRQYTKLPAYLYKVPVQDGQKQMIKRIY